jgi:hypothetical protein
LGLGTIWGPHSRFLGNIGSLLGALAAVSLAIAAIIAGSSGVGDWRAKQRGDDAGAADGATVFFHHENG